METDFAPRHPAWRTKPKQTGVGEINRSLGFLSGQAVKAFRVISRRGIEEIERTAENGTENRSPVDQVAGSLDGAGLVGWKIGVKAKGAGGIAAQGLQGRHRNGGGI